MGALYRKAKKTICRNCVNSTIGKDLIRWKCKKGKNTDAANRSCEYYCCGEYDKTTGARHRQSPCYICGKPAYSSGYDTPLYCAEHRMYAKSDDAILSNMPRDLMLCLVSGIFERARDDYISNADNERANAEKFLKSEWAQTLSIEGFDSQELLIRLNEEIEI